MWRMMFDNRQIAVAETEVKIKAKALDFVKDGYIMLTDDFSRVRFEQFHNGNLGYMQIQNRCQYDRNVQRVIGMFVVTLIIGCLFLLVLIINVWR